MQIIIFSEMFSAICSFSCDEASVDDRQAELELGGSVGHHHLQPAAEAAERGRITATRIGNFSVIFSIKSFQH